MHRRPLRMALGLILGLAALLPPAPLPAQDLTVDRRAEALGGLRALSSADAARDWQGVGRLDTGVSFCSAALIAPDLVLTAAHCLFHPETLARFPDGALTFQAGLRNGRPATLRRVRASVVLPEYVPDHAARIETIARDLALLRLDLPIGPAQAAPLPAGGPLPQGAAVTLVSYGAGREAVASIEEGCTVLEARDRVRILSCDVVVGSSGAPVLVETRGALALAAVVSASARAQDGTRMSIAVSVEEALPRLMAMQAAGETGPGGAPAAATPGDGAGPVVRRLVPGAEGGGRDGIGARFLRP